MICIVISFLMLLSLPSEVLHYLLSEWVSPQELLKISKIDRMLYSLANQNTVWKRISEREYSLPFCNKKINWKLYFFYRRMVLQPGKEFEDVLKYLKIALEIIFL